MEPDGSVNAATEAQEYQKIRLTVDSGATESVMQQDTLRAIPVKEGSACRKGTKYEVANGQLIPNLGERDFTGESEEGVRNSLKIQVADVNRDLLAVYKIVQNGSEVHFDSTGSYIRNKTTGEVIWLEEDSGMYVLSLWVKNSGF